MNKGTYKLQNKANKTIDQKYKLMKQLIWCMKLRNKSIIILIWVFLKNRFCFAFILFLSFFAPFPNMYVMNYAFFNFLDKRYYIIRSIPASWYFIGTFALLVFSVSHMNKVKT